MPTKRKWILSMKTFFSRLHHGDAKEHPTMGNGGGMRDKMVTLRSQRTKKKSKQVWFVGVVKSK